MSDDVQQRSTLSGLTAAEAVEFNRIFIISFLLFVGIALVAHVLVWLWRPWLPGPHGYQSSMLLLHGLGGAARSLVSYG